MHEPRKPVAHPVWRLEGGLRPVGPGPAAALLQPGRQQRRGFGLYISHEQDLIADDGPTIHLPASLAHVDVGDVIGVNPDGTRMSVLWKGAARHNSLLLTEQCDHLCIMCSQPPREAEDSWLFDRAEQVVSVLPLHTRQVGLTGGEPTLHPVRLLHLLAHLRSTLPDTEVHLLSNGRRFAQTAFAREYAGVDHPGLMVGIPLYAPESSLHDWIVQSPGAFDETIRGILALGGLHQRIELRVVIQAGNVSLLPRLAEFIARNLTFVEQVALMGLEMTGLARANAADVWVDPADYQAELAEAVSILTAARMRTLIFNHPLCVLDQRLRGFAVPSISDWKVQYADPCLSCDLIDDCGGVFDTSGSRISTGLHAVRLAEPVTR